MSVNDLNMHFVCTHQEAAQLIDAQEQFWVSNCGCRESKGRCARSRIDVCLIFSESDPGSGANKHPISKNEAWDILRDADQKNLVTRPYRNPEREKVVGVCFCCDDCCGYFTDSTNLCDSGSYVQGTQMEFCNQCGLCEEVCYFHARNTNKGKLIINQESCKGCGLCVDVCPEKCIDMVKREP